VSQHPSQLESLVLGTILAHPESGVLAVRVFGAYWDDAWTDVGRRSVALAIRDLVIAGKLPDALTVQSRADDDSEETIRELAAFSEAPNVLLQRTAQLRDVTLSRVLADLLRRSAARIEAGQAESPELEATAVTSRCAAIASAGVTETHVGDIITLIETQYDAIKSGNHMTGIPTGIPLVDQNLMGLPYGKMVLLAARPSHGKTSLACNIIELCLRLRDPQPVVFFSFDDDAELALSRLACIHSGVSWSHAQTARLNAATEKRYREALTWVRQAPIKLYCDRSLSPMQCRALLQSTMTTEFAGKRPLVVVDFLQKQAINVETVKDGDMRNKALVASGTWKDTIELCQVPGLVLAQLNRDGSGREPELRHLKESGNLEEDAYAALLLWREGRDDPSAPANKLRVHLAKNKGGPTCRDWLHFTGYSFRYRPWDDASDRDATEDEQRALERRDLTTQVGAGQMDLDDTETF